MGVSFKVAKVGTRYKPKQPQIEENDVENGEGNLSGEEGKVADDCNQKEKLELHSVGEEMEVSFCLNLFSNGYSLGNASELLNNVPKQLHPYDRASEALFTAIEYGWLPGDMFNDIPCKYVNGAVLCEIQDYRIHFPYKEGSTSFSGISPVVHKVILQMCMETVVKDISSISNDTWKYKDLLEIESHILKALKPDLHLSLEPLGHRFLGEPLTKKLNLEIAWSWKRRKLSDVVEDNLSSGNACFGNHNNATQKPNPQSCVAHKNGKLTSVHEKVPSSFPYPEGNNIALKTATPSNPLTLEPNSVMTDNFNRSRLTTLTTSNFVSVRNQYISNNDSGNVRRKPNSLMLSERAKYEKQAIEGPIFKKPKQEPVEFPQVQVLGSQGSISPELQWKNDVLHQQLEVENIMRDRKKKKLHSFQLINDSQRMLQGIQKQLAGSTSVKKEPDETSCFLSESGNRNSHFLMDRRIDQSNLQQLNQQLSASLSKDNFPITQTLHNYMAQPIDKNLKNESITRRRKTLQTSQVTGTGVGHMSGSSNDRNYFLSKTLSLAKGSTTKIIDSVASVNRMDAVNVNRSTDGTLLLQPAIRCDSVIKRILNIKKVAERYGMTTRKHKLDEYVGSKPFFHMPYPLVGFHLANSEQDNRKTMNSIRDVVALSKCLGICKTRTMTFSRQSHVCQASGSPMVKREAQTKLVIAEKPNEGKVEARVHYGSVIENDPKDFAMLTTFPSIHVANLFATQFTSLMNHEGYCITNDQVEFLPTNADCDSANQQPRLNFFSAAGTSEPSSPALCAVLSPVVCSPIAGTMPSSDTKQLPMLDMLSGRHLAISGKSPSFPQLTQSCLSTPQLDIAAKLSFMQRQWQQNVNGPAQLEFQMQLTQNRLEELMQRTRSMRELSPAADGLAVQLGGRTYPLDPIVCSDVRRIKGSAAVPIGGLTHWMANIAKFNNSENHITGLNVSKQLLGVVSGHQSTTLAKLHTTEDPGRAVMNAVPGQNNTDMVPIATSNVFDRVHLNSHQLPFVDNCRHIHMLQQQRWQQQMRSLREPLQVASIGEHVGTPPSQFRSRQDQQPQTSLQQVNHVSALQQMN
ncbi:Spt20 transcription factor [Quillaja saponaria]|uniref:Spt20 transcription factor n=1 Tax=Quillaja saponaria TaxID=32244 RepID=A0AAD7KPX8_QUISA|nr:Spt20 transcription factor [Quillaja saponaria]